MDQLVFGFFSICKQQMEFLQGVCAFRWCFIPNSLAWAVLVQTLYSKGDSGSVKVLISHTVVFFLSPSPKQVTSHDRSKGWNRPCLSIKSGRIISQKGVHNDQLPEKNKCVCIEALHLSIIACSIFGYRYFFLIYILTTSPSLHPLYSPFKLKIFFFFFFKLKKFFFFFF